MFNDDTPEDIFIRCCLTGTQEVQTENTDEADQESMESPRHSRERFYDVISGILTRSHCVSLGHLEPSTLRLRGRWFSVTQSCSGSERGEARGKSCHFNSVSRETKGVLCLAEELQPCMVLGLVGHTSSYVQRFYQGKSCLLVCISHTAEATSTTGQTACQNHTVTSGVNIIVLLLFCYKCIHIFRHLLLNLVLL